MEHIPVSLHRLKQNRDPPGGDIYWCMLTSRSQKDTRSNDMYFSSKESSDLGSRTFRPLINYEGYYEVRQTPPKGYQKNIIRLRDGYARRKEREAELNYKPTGENYQKLRQLPIEPFSFIAREEKRGKHPVVYFDINVTSSTKGRIIYRYGEKVEQLWHKFAQHYHLTRPVEGAIVKMVKNKLSSEFPHVYKDTLGASSQHSTK